MKRNPSFTLTDDNDHYQYNRPNFYAEHELENDPESMSLSTQRTNNHHFQLDTNKLPPPVSQMPHEHSYAHSFPPLHSYNQYHFNDNNLMDSSPNNFVFDRQPHKTVVQLPPLFPPPQMFNHQHPLQPPHPLQPERRQQLSINQVLNSPRQ